MLKQSGTNLETLSNTLWLASCLWGPGSPRSELSSEVFFTVTLKDAQPYNPRCLPSGPLVELSCSVLSESPCLRNSSLCLLFRLHPQSSTPTWSRHDMGSFWGANRLLFNHDKTPYICRSVALIPANQLSWKGTSLKGDIEKGSYYVLTGSFPSRTNPGMILCHLKPRKEGK